MNRALVLYNSKTGTTERFAGELGEFLSSQGITAKVTSIFKFEQQDLDGIDFVFLGCWTSGLMVVFQRPERTWIEFARTLPDLGNKRIALFTTYALATGSMFDQMKKHIKYGRQHINVELKSRDGHLTAHHREQVQSFLHKGDGI
jgi:flavodoxin